MKFSSAIGVELTRGGRPVSSRPQYRNVFLNFYSINSHFDVYRNMLVCDQSNEKETLGDVSHPKIKSWTWTIIFSFIN
jgi:hypothetical protein